MKFTFAAFVALAGTAYVQAHGDDQHDQESGGEVNWYSTKTSLPKKRSDLTGTVSKNKSGENKIYLIGGCDGDNEHYVADWGEGYGCSSVTNRNDAYDPEKDSYETMAPAPTARYRHTAANVDGDIYVIGGVSIDDTVITDIEKYNPETDSWSTFATWTDATTDLASFTDGTDIYLVGGYQPANDYTASDKVWKIDTTQESFTIEEVASLPQGGRGDIQAAKVGKFVYVTGGFTDADGFCDSLDVTEKFSIEKRTWEVVKSVNHPHGDNALISMNGLVYSIGGESKVNCSASSAVEFVEVYDPVVNVWKDETVIKEKTFRFVAVAYEATDSVFIFGGQSDLDETCNCYPGSDRVLHFHDQDWIVDDLGAAFSVGGNFLVMGVAAFVAVVAIMA